MIELSNDDLSDLEREVLNHYKRTWTGEYRLCEYSSEKAPFTMRFVEFLGREDELTIYATLGLCGIKPTKKPAKGEDHLPVELFLIANDPHDDLVGALFVAWQIHQTSGLKLRDTNQGGSGIIEGSPLTDVVFVRPSEAYGREMDVIQTSAGRAGLLWMLPIYQSERLYLRHRGIHRLIEAFETADIDIADFWRPNVA